MEKNMEIKWKLGLGEILELQNTCKLNPGRGFRAGTMILHTLQQAATTRFPTPTPTSTASSTDDDASL